MSEDLKNKAIELGIENAEALTPAQLKKAIEAAEAKKAISEELKVKAESLGIVVEGKSDAELEAAIGEAQSLADEINLAARQAEMLAFLSEYLGITDIDSLSKDEVKALLDEKEAAVALEIDTLKEDLGKQQTAAAAKIEVVEPKGKTDKSYKASNGKEYVFADDAPAAFRYLGQHRTQEDWITDEDALELMVAGRLTFLTLKK